MSGLNRLKRLVESLVTYTVAGEWLKFTEDQSSTPAIGQYISALSNAAAMAGYKNGYIVWGVDESNREVVGTDFAWRRNQNGEPLAQWLARQVSPDVGFRFYEVSVRGKRVVVLEIPAARGVPTSFAGERWICIGSSTEKLSKYPERESQIFEVLRHGLPSVENTPTSYQNLTFTQLFTYFAGQGVELTRESFRANLKLLTADGRYNLLAQLLSDDSRIPIRFSVFAGTTKTAPLYTVREFGNACLLVSINKVLDYGEVLNVPQADERNRVVVRKEVQLFDQVSWREAVINAFIHNQWTSGMGPAFTAYSDRIEILSRGTFAPGQTVEGFFAGESVPVNGALADMVRKLHSFEQFGRGVPQIVERYGRKAIGIHETSIRVTLPYERVPLPEVSRPSESVRDERAALSKNRSRMLAAMRDNPTITQVELGTALSLSKTAVYNNVTWLKKHGCIERVGSKKAGWWRVL